MCTLIALDLSLTGRSSGKVQMVQCKNEEVDRVVAHVISRRQNHEWSHAVKGRLGFVNDLRVENAI